MRVAPTNEAHQPKARSAWFAAPFSAIVSWYAQLRSSMRVNAQSHAGYVSHGTDWQHNFGGSSSFADSIR